MPRTNVVPRGPGKDALAARDTLSQFLEANLMRPLLFSETQAQAQIETALDTMTLAERIAIDIEMSTRFAPVHSFDYDPFATR
jgi:hypothetical protein